MSKYKECVHCILDTHDDPDMVFDQRGWCNYCTNYEKNYILNPLSVEEKTTVLNEKIRQIKAARRGQYDCLLGVSGGVDSSFLAYKCKQLGLNPLLVHFDNGWNSELAVNNIENITKYTGFDLYTYVVDWEEFKDLQLSYIKASVLDWEIPTDHGFYALLYKLTSKFKIRYILTGHNHQTEAILPKTMRHSKMDVANLLDIHKTYGTKKLKTFPVLDFWNYNYYNIVKKVERFNLLEYLDEYNKDKAKAIIQKELGWRDYGGKHYESIFTRFYQGYVLLEKFGFDKRRAHLSNLICSGQITREEALAELKKPAYDPEVYKTDRAFVIKKLGLTEQEFDTIMKTPPRSHLEFKSYLTGLYVKHVKFMESIKPVTRMMKRLAGKS